MKRYSILAFIFLAVIGAFAQNISVADFQLRETDMTAASRDGRRIDQNGQPAALIRIETTETGFVFEAGALGIVDSKQETGEVWVWVPRASRKITIKHPKLGVLYDYRYPVEIEAERTYWMKLTTATIETIVKEQVRQQYLAFKITPPNAILEVNDQLWSVDADGTAMQYVEFGTYSYRVRAANYHPDAGLVTVDDPDNTKLVTVNLKPNLAEVTLKVDADAEIWVNNEKKGVRTWTGGLGKGVYKIECRQAGHETTMVSKEITDQMNGETILLAAPKPIYGSLMVESTPNFAKLYVDGRDMGNTPKSINEILVGQHEIRLTQDGYTDHTETVTVTKGEKKKVRAELSKRTITSNTSQSSIQQTSSSIPQGAVRGVFSVSPTKKVHFAQGNLQYQASTNTWRFASNQWDMIGKGNENISSTYSGWIDLFGWGTGNAPTNKYGFNSDYPIFTDWGSKMGKGWRTLTKDEWVYVFDERSTSSGIRYAKANIDGVDGVILLPDNWNKSTYRLKKTNERKVKYSSNKISVAQWNSKFYPAGAVFLPAAGHRIWDLFTHEGFMSGYTGQYWSASPHNDDNAYWVYFDDGTLNPSLSVDRSIGRSVRLVCPAEN